jgi:site-specific DNA recombinase
MDQADAAVWHEVCQLLEDPDRLEQEYRQRLEPAHQEAEANGLAAQIGKVRRGLTRLIDSYADGLIEKSEFEPRVIRLRERLQHLEAQVQQLNAAAEQEAELRMILNRLETFRAKVKEGLQSTDFHTRREIIRTLVKRVEVDMYHIRIVFRVSPTTLPTVSSDVSPNWQHWGRRVHTRGFHRDMAEFPARSQSANSSKSSVIVPKR